MLTCMTCVEESVALQIMKSDEDVRMISAEAPVLFAKVLLRFCALHLTCNNDASACTVRYGVQNVQQGSNLMECS